MSANLIVDLGSTAFFATSISQGATAVVSGTAVGISGQAVVGQWIDMSQSDTFCNVYVAAGPCSGPLMVAVQSCIGPYDVPLNINNFSGNIFSGGAPMSGSFTDPTSGLAQLPTWFSSGGVLVINSGFATVPGQLGASGQQVAGYPQGTLPFGPTPVNQGQNGPAFVGSGAIPEFASGGIAFAAFQRPYQYCRLVVLSGATQVNFLQAGFISNLRTVGSGGGFSYQPQLGTVNV